MGSIGGAFIVCLPNTAVPPFSSTLEMTRALSFRAYSRKVREIAIREIAIRKIASGEKPSQ